MSYSFRSTGTTKDEAVSNAQQAVDQVVVDQPTHAADGALIKSAVAQAVAILSDDADRDVQVDCYGSLSWTTRERVEGQEGDAYNFRQVDLHVSATLIPRPAEALPIGEDVAQNQEQEQDLREAAPEEKHDKKDVPALG